MTMKYPPTSTPKQGFQSLFKRLENITVRNEKGTFHLYFLNVPYGLTSKAYKNTR